MPNGSDALSHALVEDVESLGGGWEVLDVIRVQNGVSFRHGGSGRLWARLPRILRKDVVWIVARREG